MNSGLSRRPHDSRMASIILRMGGATASAAETLPQVTQIGKQAQIETAWQLMT